MVVGLGIDAVGIARLAAVLERHPERARRRLFTPAELEECEARSDSAECLAARFAAKEAFSKALGTGLSRGISWHDIVLDTREGGCPHLTATGGAARRLSELGADSIHVSLTHDAGVAVAVVILERAADGSPSLPEPA